ncbi:serine--tRNA ligase [Candidatus Woesearchaeota archaeon]|nr:serine--tRNA ligase [Candidatus Woesearchaeota archaeon]
MLDIRWLREHPDAARKDLQKRGDAEKAAWLEELLQKDRDFREKKQHLDELRHRRNLVTDEIRVAKKAGKDAAKLLKEAKTLPEAIAVLEKETGALEERVRFLLMRLPNILHESVPQGADDSGNVVVREHGKRPVFSFAPKSHLDLLEKLDLADIPRAARSSGARFYYLKGKLVLLDLALMRLATDMLVRKGFTMVLPPFMLRRKPYEGVTDLADFENVMYKIEGEDLYLIATSEHPIAALHMDEVIPEKQLPLRYAGISPCFRKEAGAHGKDTKGIFRVHQFNKVEQFVFSRPEESWHIHEELLSNAEEFFKAIELPYRVVSICTGDIGIVAAKKYDLEAWMPAQQTYREMVSCSNCTSYQAVRLNARFERAGEREYLHTLNSTMVATPRALVAILENFQQEDGSVRIPKVLHPYLPFKELA